MKSSRHPDRRTPLFRHFICSLLLHALVFSLPLFIPIQSGGAGGDVPKGYFISLQSDWPGVNGMRRAAAAETETAASPDGMTTEASEERPENNTPEMDTEKAALTEPERKDSEAAEATVLKENPFSVSPDATEHISAAEGKGDMPQAPENERTAQPASQKKAVNGGKAEQGDKLLLSAGHNKAVIPADVQQREQKKGPALEKMPAPTVAQKKPEKGVRPRTKQLPASSGPKDMTPQIPPEDMISNGQEMPASDGNFLQERFGGPGFSPGAAASTPAAKTVYATEKDDPISPPAFEAKYTEKNNDGRVDEKMMKKDATGVSDAQAAAAATAIEKKADHTANAGGDEKVVKALKQAGQKNGEAGRTKNGLLKRANGQPENAGSGLQERDTGLKTLAGKNDPPVLPKGLGADRRSAGRPPQRNQNGRSASASGTAAGRTPAEGDENKAPVLQADAGTQAEAGDPEAKSVPGIMNLSKSYNGKSNEKKLYVNAEPASEPKKSSFGVPAQELPNQKDIRIEVLLKSGETTGVFMQLFRKSYPGQHRRNGRDKQEQAETTAEKTVMKSVDKAAPKHVFAAAHAEKAVYIFVLENKENKPCAAAIDFYLYEGKEKERIKKYNNEKILPGGRLRFKFIMPEAFFWDDDERFSGNAEDSRSTTKFHYESGLVWREEKDPPK